MKRGMLLLAVSLFTSSPAWALFNVQVLTGKRSTDFKGSGVSEDLSGNELKAAAHLDPIPLVPIGFGLSVSQLTWDNADKFNYEKIDGFEVGLEFEAWSPMAFLGFLPYAKLGYTIAGAYAAKSKSILGAQPTTLYSPSGVYLAAGLKYEFLLRLGLMLEIEKSTRTLAFDKIEDLGAVPAGTLPEKDLDADSLSILFGIQAGL